MTERKPELWLQLTAGQGPAECAWAVVRVLEQLQMEAVAASVECCAIEIVAGPEPGTANSALLSIWGPGAELFAASWCGTVQWTARSPFRPHHKRRNWFVRIEAIEPVEETRFDPKDLRWETMRASGPGGQHVNRTESAVRVTHVLTGIQATAMEERSQHRNRKLALARLLEKVEEADRQAQSGVRQERWRGHRRLERGNPIRVLSPH